MRTFKMLLAILSMSAATKGNESPTGSITSRGEANAKTPAVANDVQPTRNDSGSIENKSTSGDTNAKALFNGGAANDYVMLRSEPRIGVRESSTVDLKQRLSVPKRGETPSDSLPGKPMPQGAMGELHRDAVPNSKITPVAPSEDRIQLRQPIDKSST